MQFKESPDEPVISIVRKIGAIGVVTTDVTHPDGIATAKFEPSHIDMPTMRINPGTIVDPMVPQVKGNLPLGEGNLGRSIGNTVQQAEGKIKAWQRIGGCEGDDALGAYESVFG